jgi:hypothetical protein
MPTHITLSVKQSVGKNAMAVVLCFPYLPGIAPYDSMFPKMKLNHEEKICINVLEIPEISLQVLNSIMPDEFQTSFQCQNCWAEYS